MIKSVEKHYVLGFAFNNAVDHVVLIHKNRPQWQAGKINGIGGKVEPGEIPIFSMQREFYEETGIETVFHDWKQFAMLEFKKRCHGWYCVCTLF